MVFPYSILVQDFTMNQNHTICYRHGAGLIEAESDDEAFGKVTKLALKVYPKPVFVNHHVVIGGIDVIADIDDVKAVPSKHG